MDFIRFSSSQRYGSRVPVRQLAFRVTVSRALVVEEDSQEELCSVLVPWDSKVLSPSERLAVYKELHTVAFSDATGSNLVDARGSLLQRLPRKEDMVAHLQSPAACFFTRPSTEDFIDVTEEDFPVDPPQGPSRLAPVVLRQHRKDHQPNNNMYFMWAVGGVQGTRSLTAIATPLAVSSSPQTGGEADMELMQGVASDDAAGDAASVPIAALSWSGQERVMCTITAERSEHFFTTKPSLNEFHTLMVDSLYIYSFKVEVVAAESSSNDGDGRLAISVGLGRGYSVPTNAVEQVEETMRVLSSEVTEKVAGLQQGQRAAARRLLKETVRLLALDPTHGFVSTDASSGGVASSSVRHSQTTAHGTIGMGAALTSPTRAGRAKTGAHHNRSTLLATGMGGIPGGGATASIAQPPARGRTRYHVFGVLERTLGIEQDSVFLRVEFQRDTRHEGCDGEGGAPDEGVALKEVSAMSTENTFTTQLAFAGRVVHSNVVFDVDHVFNAPFSFSYVDATVAAAPLRLVVTAFTEGAGAEGHQAPVGYTSVSLPTACPGRHNVKALLWVPHKNGKEFLKSALLGGAPSLVDPRQAGPSLYYRTGISVKEGLASNNAGELHVTVNVLHHQVV